MSVNQGIRNSVPLKLEKRENLCFLSRMGATFEWGGGGQKIYGGEGGGGVDTMEETIAHCITLDELFVVSKIYFTEFHYVFS